VQEVAETSFSTTGEIGRRDRASATLPVHRSPSRLAADFAGRRSIGLVHHPKYYYPLSELTIGAEALARGDFRHQVNVAGNDELAVLGKAFNHAARQLDNQFEMTLEARVGERTRIAREIHDTLLQSFHGLLLGFQTVFQLLPERPVDAKQKLGNALEEAHRAITEGRDAVQGLRGSVIEGNDLPPAISILGEELARHSINSRPAFRVAVEGESRDLHPILRDEVYKIVAEALRNAFRHSEAPANRG